MDLTTAGLVADIQLNALLPDGMYEDSDIISFLNDGFFTDTLAFIMRFREDFYATTVDYDSAASIEIPVDAIAQKLKDVQIKRGDNYSSIPRLSMGEVTSNNNSYNRPNGFYIQDNSIVFYPSAPTGSVRLVYFKRPNYLIESDIVTSYKVLSIDNINNRITFNKDFEGTVFREFALSKIAQPNNVDTVTTISPTAGAIGYFSADDFLKISVGDYICNTSHTVYPKIPYEARDLLVQAAIVKIMISMKDKDGYKLAQDQLKEAKSAVAGLISPRIENETKKIVNTGPLWGQGNRGWRR